MTESTPPLTAAQKIARILEIRTLLSEQIDLRAELDRLTREVNTVLNPPPKKVVRNPRKARTVTPADPGFVEASPLPNE